MVDDLRISTKEKTKKMLKLRIMALFNKDARIIYEMMKAFSIPADQLYIHDDEKCLCGSGKLYADCCKGKEDIGPVVSRKPPEVLVNERMRKSLKSKYCLHPDKTTCQGKIKDAHALQNHKIISLLASDDNHVMMQDATRQPIIIDDNPLNPISILPFERVSGNKATTQSCFCDKHDTELFRPIEAGAPDFDPNSEEMKFIYAYKAFIFEYSKQLQLMSIFRELFAERPQVFTLPDMVKEYRTQCMRMEEFEPIKNHFDSQILAGTHNGVETCIVKIPYRIGFACYAYISPDFDIDGNRVKTIDADGKMHRLAVTVIPEEKRSYILLSCLSTETPIYQEFFRNIENADLDKVLFYFNCILPLFSENLVLSEKLWNAQGEKGQLGLIHETNLIGNDQFNLSQTFRMALRNLSKSKKPNYSKRGKVDLFQIVQEEDASNGTG